MTIEKKTIRSDIPGHHTMMMNSISYAGTTQEESRRLVIGREITLNGNIAACEHLVIEGTVEAQNFSARRLDILVSIPGISAITAFALLIDMPELGTLGQSQAASLAGLAPVARQSGHWTGRAFIRGGRANVRQALYMPALVALRFNPDLKAKYDQLKAAGKASKVAITAIMRKLILLANALLRDGRNWTPSLP